MKRKKKPLLISQSEIYLQQPGIPSLPQSIFRKKTALPPKVYLFLSIRGNGNGTILIDDIYLETKVL